jgi:hypothetical protein
MAQQLKMDCMKAQTPAGIDIDQNSHSNKINQIQDLSNEKS